MKSAHGKSVLLRRALRGNGVFSTVSGIAFIAGAKPIAAAIGFDYPLAVGIIGASLLLFAAGVFRNAARERISRVEASLSVAGDLVWVIASGVIIALGFLSTAGNWTVAVMADIVLVFAIFQFVGLRRIGAE